MKSVFISSQSEFRRPDDAACARRHGSGAAQSRAGRAADVHALERRAAASLVSFAAAGRLPGGGS